MPRESYQVWRPGAGLSSSSSPPAGQVWSTMRERGRQTFRLADPEDVPFESGRLGTTHRLRTSRRPHRHRFYEILWAVDGADACYMLFVLLNQAFPQSLALEEVRGRVLGISTATSFGLMPLGGLAAGAAAQRWGASPVLAVGGAVRALVALGVLLARPRLRRLA